MRTNRIDYIIVAACAIGLLLCLYGIQWGRVESWNPDQMALRPLFIEGKAPLQPYNYQKPPFHTYLNYFLAEIPARVARKLLRLPYCSTNYFILIFSRFLTSILFLGSGLILYLIIKDVSAIGGARIVSFIFLTSAGVITFVHFLTADIPVLFWMLLAFYFCHKIILYPRIIFYFFAGLITGIATATKYNGLAVGIAIPVAHAMTYTLFPFKLSLVRDLFFNKKLIVSLLMVPVGFILGCPYAIIDYQTFISDFLYNYRVTPIYSGIQTGNSYLSFIMRLTELVGWPYFVIMFISFVFLLFYFMWRGKFNNKKKILILALSVFFLYYIKLGSFPRMETRFVLPVIPYVIIISFLFWEMIKSKRMISITIVSMLLVYNIMCSLVVGYRFLSDPRMRAQLWVRDNVPSDARILTSPYVPRWDKLCNVQVQMAFMPSVSGRGRLFKEQFKDDPFIMNYVDYVEKKEDEVDWYESHPLEKMNFDYISINSLFYERFLGDSELGKAYPSIKLFFSNILSTIYPYTLVYDEENTLPPMWVYPQNIDFLKNRMTILTRQDN